MSQPKSAAAATYVAEKTRKDRRARRETVESIAIAVILAFLFRAFVAEAFVIPTGSMAPTLQGRHMDVVCAQCGKQYRTGASVENVDEGVFQQFVNQFSGNGNRSNQADGEVVATTCPVCRYTMPLDKVENANQRSFNGDRILVSKFSYDLADPERWDVIVFKYPGNAKQNYIKRLVGLPNETLRIRHGNVYRRPEPAGAGQGGGDAGFQIVRKPPHKLAAMLQLVDDSHHVPPALTEAGWPSRWQDWNSQEQPAWKKSDTGPGFVTTEAAAGRDAWLGYRHVVPSFRDWQQIADGRTPQRLADGAVRGQLITDYYEYNAGIQDQDLDIAAEYGDPVSWRPNGLHWVGDLAGEFEVEVLGSSGEVLLELIEGGVHFLCRIDVTTGEATLAIDGGKHEFRSPDGVTSAKESKGSTKLRGPGRHQLKFANCDDEMRLWVDGRFIEFGGPTTYDLGGAGERPTWSEQDAGDLEPVRIGARGVGLRVERAKVLRDVYYVAIDYSLRADSDYDYSSATGGNANLPMHSGEIQELFASPEQWAASGLFDARRAVDFRLGDQQYFPLGDNSPQSRDGRLWSSPSWQGEPYPPPYIDRRLLIGKALLIYWPHAWRRPVPFWPNFERMGLIR